MPAFPTYGTGMPRQTENAFSPTKNGEEEKIPCLKDQGHMSLQNCDQRALPTAQAVLTASDADLVILFGSRARGDYEEGRSDIDLLVVQPHKPTPAQRQTALEAAGTASQKAYQTPTPVHINWQTTDEFEQRRLSINHMCARAVQEGVIMARNAENYPREPNDYSYESEIINLRSTNAETHYQAFENYHYLFELGMTDAESLDRIAGKNAQEALEHALKCLIATCGSKYPHTHDLNELVTAANEADPVLANIFQPSIDYEVLNRYSGSEDYGVPESPITEVEHYRESVSEDYRRIRERIDELLDELLGE